MPAFQLDRLGWFDFERLIQGLLKSEFGATIQDWAGYQDFGKDAYCETDLKGRSHIYQGPIVFQAKFVHGANAAGAKYWKAIKGAVEKESERILERIKTSQWTEPKSYFLLTNCPVSPTERQGLTKIIATATGASITILGEKDISDLLDMHPRIARSYPQILTYVHLLSLLETPTSKAITSRSHAALNEAELLLPIFAPTLAYERAWEKLFKYDFAVLTGPPEMGKTSIGRMIAMAQLANGWEVIDCFEPNDIFIQHDPNKLQVFLADDAFGRTEYDVSRGVLWEAQFSKIRQKLDKKHWLIWTSRKHILENAIRQMDLQGTAKGFPKPAEIIVQADWLSPDEKAQILFRHVVNANLGEAARAMLKRNLRAVIGNPKFTPERIRKLVTEVLPSLEAQSSALSADQVALSIRQVLENPTEMMEKAYSKLPEQQKWLLTTLLDEENVSDLESASEAFKRISPLANTRLISEMLSELDEGFLRITTKPIILNGTLQDDTSIGWVHPSYRDLIIDQLQKNRPMRLRYLETGGISAITLAISQVGGAKGDRSFPLLPDKESWDGLQIAVVEILSSAPSDEFESLLMTIAGSIKESKSSNVEIAEFARAVCVAIASRQAIDEDAFSPRVLESFFEIAEKSKEHVPPPALEASWNAVWEPFRDAITEHDQDSFELDGDKVYSFARVLGTLYENEPRFLKRVHFKTVVLPLVTRAIEIIQEDASGFFETDEPDLYDSEEERLNTLGRAVDAFKPLQSLIKQDLDMLEAEADSQARHMGYRALSARENGESDEPWDAGKSQGNERVDPTELFREVLG